MEINFYVFEIKIDMDFKNLNLDKKQVFVKPNNDGYN